MSAALGYAESIDPTATNLTTVLAAALIVALIAGMAGILILIIRSRKNRRAEFLTAAAILWALITAGSLIQAQQAQMNWSKEYKMRIESGYLDPRDTSDAPKLPWGIWAGLGMGYVAMLAWSLSRKSEKSS